MTQTLEHAPGVSGGEVEGSLLHSPEDQELVKRTALLEKFLGDDVHKYLKLPVFGRTDDIQLRRVIPKTSEAYHPLMEGSVDNILEMELRNATRANVRHTIGVGPVPTDRRPTYEADKLRKRRTFFAELRDTVDLPPEIEMVRRKKDTDSYLLVRQIKEDSGSCQIYLVGKDGRMKEGVAWTHPFRFWMTDEKDPFYAITHNPEHPDSRMSSLKEDDLDAFLQELEQNATVS